MRAIIQYTEGSHIGDADVVRNLSSQFTGSISRDTYAFTDNQQCILFQMKFKEIVKIKDTYEHEWRHLHDLGLRRHKNHQILIDKEVKVYILNLKNDISSYNSSADQSQSDSQSQNDGIIKDSEIFDSDDA